MERYTIDEIYYNLDVARDGLYDSFANSVCEALSFLDKKIVDEISKKVLFFSSDYIRDSTSCHLMLNTSFSKDRKMVIFYSEEILKGSKKEIIKKILHEIAHFYLNHKQCFDLNKKQIGKQEKEADKLARRWLKNGFRENRYSRFK